MAHLELSDDVLLTIVPIIAYWLFSGLYEILGRFDRYRLHPKVEEDEKNIVSRGTVLKGMIRQQAIQIAVVVLTQRFINNNYKGREAEPQPSALAVTRQFLVAMLVEDAWQYLGHRFLHSYSLLYKHIHSTHHSVVAPYAYAALYKNPAEFFILDAVAGSLAFVVSGMTPRTGIYFFTFATVKAVDVHSGLWLPWNPLRFLFGNNCAYHDVHHQLKGHKHNFSQPFFVAWDRIFGTHMDFSVVERRGGGFEVRLPKSN
ncbi:sphinganine C4-monooxygenase 2-like isoform X4 [Asparagus officinalis]|uniref:sphinganine C4-monooxygenase 2-like isoform X4 n=1 Tax=Asparagus officinalis TaxID=4686 RepID=UPI00098E6C90|nr:sphinganine C4-monooxygenase 2-like isoform X4 [Asparagus officinalis]